MFENTNEVFHVSVFYKRLAMNIFCTLVINPKNFK